MISYNAKVKKSDRINDHTWWIQLDFLIQAEQTLQEQSDPGGHPGSRKRPGDPDSEDTEDSEVAKRNKVASNDFQVSLWHVKSYILLS